MLKSLDGSPEKAPSELEGLELLNHVANQPEVLAYVAPGYEWVSLDRFFDNPRNVMLGNEHGLILFIYLRPGVYEGHYLLTKSLRGLNALRACRMALNTIFTHYGASLILGFVPRQNRASRAITRALGFTPFGSMELADTPFAMFMMRREDYEFRYGPNRRQ